VFKEALHLLTQEYSLILATTEKDFQAVKKVREEVFSPKYTMSPELLESKGYLFSQDDKQSFLYLLRHNDTDKYVGTVRVFFINEHTAVQKMPMQKDGNVQGIEHFTQKLPIVEISRGALIKDLPQQENLSALQLRTILTYGLMVATRINFILYSYSMVFSIMEPSLHRILKRQGVNFEQIGEAVEYYGIRTPFAIERKKLLNDTEETMGQITKFYLKELCQDPESFWQFIDNNPYLEHSDIQLDRICQLFEEHGDDVSMELLLGENDLSTTD
jgi:N-acyl amino acid synthase of PEP-CTERM/exosortase system